jgi:hypothetical protein
MQYSVLNLRFSLFSIASILLCGFFLSCNSPGTMHQCAPPNGKYVNATVLSKCPGMMPSDIPHFCFEMNFINKDTVEIDNGFEHFSLKYSASADGCSYTVHGATLFGDMVLTLDSDSSLQLIDTAWTKLKTYSAFKKLPSDHEGGFETLLNECVVAGEYAIFENGNLRPHQVTLLANGQLNGFKPFLGYSLCYAGDCLEETDPPSRTIDLVDEKGEKHTFAFKNIEGKMALELYSIGPPIPDMKGGRRIGSMIYELRTE